MFFNISEFTVFPLFPSTVGMTKIESDMTRLDFIKNINYNPINIDRGNRSQISDQYNILDEFEIEKCILLDSFNNFIKNILQLKNSKFYITTSWATKCEKNQYSEYHLHKNSFYSGVFYIDDILYGGELEFINTGLIPSSILVTQSVDANAFNSETFFLRPEKNNVVFFPSYLMHRIRPHLDDDPRFSIAFNIMPRVPYGEFDSSIF